MRDGARWSPLPAWSRFLLDLGATIGNYDPSGARLVVALGLPTRAYAAPLIAAGVVAARLGVESPADAAAHFASLCFRGPGTPVLLEISGRRETGTLTGCQTYRGEHWAKVFVQASRETHFVSETEALRITILGDPSKTGTIDLTAARSSVQRRVFIRHSLGRKALANMARESRLECVIIGRRSLLCQEAVELRVGIPSIADPARFQRARLSDVLRIRKLLRPGDPYRSDVLSNIGRRAAKGADKETPRITVFDGATSFLKWRYLWPESSWILLLDRTEPRCREAAASLDMLYSTRSVSGRVALPLGLPPEGIDIAAFHVASAARRTADA